MTNILPFLKKEWKEERFIVLCLGITFLLRIPSVLEPYWYGDEGIYLTLGIAIRKGLLLYQQIHDNKPPLLYLIAALAGNVAWFRTILLVWMLATVIAFWQLTKKILGKQTFIAKATTLFFVVFSSIPLIEGNIANAEIFMIGPIILAFLIIFGLYQNTYRYWQLLSFLAGLLLSLSFMLKVPAVFDFIALIGLAIFFIKRENLTQIAGIVFFILVGFITPIIASGGYFYLQGALSDYIYAAFLQNFGYVSSWKTGTMSNFDLSSKIGLISRGGLVAIFYGLLFVLRHKLSKKEIFVFLWFAFALFGALLSERPYPHYLIQVLPPLSLTLGILFAKKFISRLVGMTLIGSLALSVLLLHFWAYGVFGYYLNFLGHDFKSQRNDYFSYFGNIEHIYQTAEYLKDKTTKGERIFIWGDLPHLYALSRTLPPGRYTSTYHIVDFGGYDETLEKIAQFEPRYVVIDINEKRPFAQLASILSEKYILEKKFGNLIVLHRSL